MTRVLVATSILLVARPAYGQRVIDERIPAASTGFIRIHNMVGSVRVTGWASDTIAVSGTVVDAKMERFALHRSESGVKISLWDVDATQAAPSHLEVRVPAGSHVWIKTASADITVEGVAGGVDLYSVTGHITVNGSPREIFVESMGGAVAIAADTRTARATTASGPIRLSGTIAEASARSVSGSVTITDARFERGRFESVEGDIRYEAVIGPGSWLDFVNHSGGVEFVLTPRTAAEFVVSTLEGRLDDRYGVRVRRGGNKLKGQELSFAIGDGGGHVNVRNFKGQVVLRRK